MELTLSGDLSGLSVTVDGMPCAPVVLVDATRARCTAPAHPPAVVPIAVSSVDGSASLAAGLVYLTPGAYQMGGPADDRTSGVAVDAEGSLYLSGGTNGALDGPGAGAFDALLAKYDAAGRLLRTRQLGTSVWDYARDVAIDPGTGDVLIVGYGAGDIDGDGVTAGGTDVFVARFTADGARVWVRQIGSAGNDEAWDLAVDAGGNTVVSMWTDAAFAGATHAGGLDHAVARLTRDGSLAWVRQVGTPSDDQAHSVGVARDGTAYIVGCTRGALEEGRANAGDRDLFIARYDTDGSRAWIRQRGSATSDQAFDVTVDASGRPWLVGATNGSLDGQANAGGDDVLVMRFSSTGDWELTRLRGSAGNEMSFGLAIDAAGRVFCSFHTPLSLDGQSYSGGPNDVGVFAWSPDGSHGFTRLSGSPGNDLASSIAVAPIGLVYVSVVTDGALDARPSRGGDDAAVLKLDGAGAFL
ncbi:MAG: IPT/TIG domain-containing protein [Deltaproteobacteria bacterium]